MILCRLHINNHIGTSSLVFRFKLKALLALPRQHGSLNMDSLAFQTQQRSPITNWIGMPCGLFA